MYCNAPGYAMFETKGYRRDWLGFVDFLTEVITLPVYVWKRIRPFHGQVVLIEQDTAMSPGSWYIRGLRVRNWRGKVKSHYCQIGLFDVKPGDKVSRNLFAMISQRIGRNWYRVKRYPYVD